MLTYYAFSVRDSNITSGDNRKTGISFGGIGSTPGIVFAKRLVDGAQPAVLPVITEIGGGDYEGAYDPELYGEIDMQVDCGASLTNYGDRMRSILMTKDSGRLQTALPPIAPGATGGLINSKTGMVLDPTGLDQLGIEDPGPVSNQTTLRKRMNALWRRWFGPTSLTKTGPGTGTLTTIADDGVTVNTTQVLTDTGTSQSVSKAQ